MAIRLAKVFGSTSVIWVRMQAAYDLAVALREEGRIRVARYEPRRGS
jgi:plasmid maintenance system antidote protein VapI